MSGRILQFEDHRHGQAQRLLPWLVNGRLDDEERAWVERHIADCRDCGRELLALQDMQSALRLEAEGEDAAAQSTVDGDWQRLRVRLRTAPGRRSPALRTLLRQWRQAPRWMAAAVAIQAVAVIVLAVLLWRPPSTAGTYRTLGATPAASAGNLVIVFEPHLEQARVAALLRASQARIVDGPSDAGAYVLAVAPARLTTVRAALRAAPGVTLVATLPPGSEQ